MAFRHIATLLALLISGMAGAQASPPDYAAWRGREIKALSAQQIDDLREGRGMGLSLPAELNGAPGPLHALGLASALALTPDQTRALTQIVDQMKAGAQRLGLQLIEAERALDEAFRSGTATPEAVARLSAEAAELQGQLRNVHLQAHLQTRQLLRPGQVDAYMQARGYAAEQGLGSGHHH